MESVDLATLDTLPHGLPGDAEQAHGLIHGEISVRSFLCNALTQIIGETNPPRSAGVICSPAMMPSLSQR